MAALLTLSFLLEWDRDILPGVLQHILVKIDEIPELRIQLLVLS